tara:strand:+ start:587 stop:907 length:321 start_codon:yes stop_codon:yes gene_type:complete
MLGIFLQVSAFAAPREAQEVMESYYYNYGNTNISWAPPLHTLGYADDWELWWKAWWGFAIVPPEATQQTPLGANEPQPYELYESYYYDMPVGSVLDLEFNQTSLRE